MNLPMNFPIENFLKPAAVETLKSAGLHKVMGAIHGCQGNDLGEMTIKEAVTIIGAKFHVQRRENAKIAAGLVALAEISGEKL